MNDQAAQSRPLPHHERHRRTLLAAIAAESAREQASGRPARSPEPGLARAAGARARSLPRIGSPRRGWVTPVMAAAAVLVVVAAGVGVHALVRPASQPGTRPTPATMRSAGSRPSPAGGGEWTVTQRYTVPAPVGSLIVNDTAGSVAVTAGSGSEVSVTAKIYYRTSRPSISHTVSRRTLALGYSACADCGVAFTITVPRAASVTINEHTGKVTVASVAGDVSVSDDTGMISLTDLSGDVSVHDGTGAISGTGLSAARASFSDRDGMTELTFTAPPRQLIAESGTGMVSIRVPSGTTYRVEASSKLGMVDDSVPQSAAATHMITATTGTGMVSVSTG